MRASTPPAVGDPLERVAEPSTDLVREFLLRQSQGSSILGNLITADAQLCGVPVAPRRYGYMSYGYSSPTYYGGYGIARGIARRNIRRAAYGGIGYRGVGVRRGLGVGVGRVGRFR
jgi:hypothetical protein